MTRSTTSALQAADPLAAPLRVLLVCEGNICRSPMAAALLAARLYDAGIAGAVTVASAGVRTEPGLRIDRSAVRALASVGVESVSHRSVPLAASEAGEADVLLAATTVLRDAAVAAVPAARDRAFAWRELLALAAAGPLTVPGAARRTRWQSLIEQVRQRRGLVRGDFDVPDPIGARAAAFDALAVELDASMTDLAVLLLTAVQD